MAGKAGTDIKSAAVVGNGSEAIAAIRIRRHRGRAAIADPTGDVDGDSSERPIETIVNMPADLARYSVLASHRRKISIA